MIYFLLILQVHSAYQITGFKRTKRGYKPQIRGLPIVGGGNDVALHNNEARPNSLPNDPLYGKQWYIVSKITSIGMVTQLVLVCRDG